MNKERNVWSTSSMTFMTIALSACATVSTIEGGVREAEKGNILTALYYGAILVPVVTFVDIASGGAVSRDARKTAVQYRAGAIERTHRQNSSIAVQSILGGGSSWNFRCTGISDATITGQQRDSFPIAFSFNLGFSPPESFSLSSSEGSDLPANFRVSSTGRANGENIIFVSSWSLAPVRGRGGGGQRTELTFNARSLSLSGTRSSSDGDGRDFYVIDARCQRN